MQAQDLSHARSSRTNASPSLSNPPNVGDICRCADGMLVTNSTNSRLEPPPDPNAIAGEGIWERRRSSQISRTSSGDPVDKRLPQVFSETVPGEDDDHRHRQESMDAESEEPPPGFLGRVESYRRLMHAHTKSQLASPDTGTLPAYTRTMHAFTRNQLHHHRRSSKSETSSPHIGPKQAILLSKVRTELTKLSWDELPHGPSNTPEKGLHDERVGGLSRYEFPARRRSLTEPNAVRDFAVVKQRELANVGAVAV